MKYIVEITETFKNQIKIEAENKDDALQYAKEQYDEKKIILSDKNLIDLSIDIIE